jgi:hypothetical protein
MLSGEVAVEELKQAATCIVRGLAAASDSTRCMGVARASAFSARTMKG